MGLVNKLKAKKAEAPKEGGAQPAASPEPAGAVGASLTQGMMAGLMGKLGAEAKAHVAEAVAPVPAKGLEASGLAASPGWAGPPASGEEGQRKESMWKAAAKLNHKEEKKTIFDKSMIQRLKVNADAEDVGEAFEHWSMSPDALHELPRQLSVARKEAAGRMLKRVKKLCGKDKIKRMTNKASFVQGRVDDFTK